MGRIVFHRKGRQERKDYAKIPEITFSFLSTKNKPTETTFFYFVSAYFPNGAPSGSGFSGKKIRVIRAIRG
jgi:hypothetical protein